MIADKILPALYVIDLEGEAASLEFLVGQNFGIQKVVIGSLDFNHDLDAASAGQDAIDFFLDNPKLSDVNLEESVEYNPEFFPTIPAITPTEEQLDQEEAAEEHFADQIEDEGQFAVIVTKRFDSLGDYVTCRLESKGDNYKVKMRVAINPEVYLNEKGKMMENIKGQGSQPHREITTAVFIH